MSRTWGRVVLAVGLVGVVISGVDWAVSGRVAWSDAFPLFLAAAAGAELSTGARRRALRTAAAVVLLTVGFAVGVPAAADLVSGAPVDWLDLTLGVLTVLYAVVGTVALLARRRANGSAPA
ncbi:hypothetical protein [Streptomyces sp. WMMC940]|uniref:hypothetical protein n=1 Tax=Streptomyces sp. WMMC940 TaxID=3015153 RepID=UPI0022B6068D|nr:hypothetical protein [Streptomyces sp. WMMC940]MCZ7460356.1 hypothetical protein [Streptomyces sp. WMMC940]